MKTPMSRFQIHDDLTAPEGSVAVLRGALSSGGQLPNFLGVLAGSPAALRAYARFRSELRHGKLTLATLERIALAVAEHYHSESGIAMHSRAARAAGLAFDEVALARQFSSKDERESSSFLFEGSRLKVPRPAKGSPRSLNGSSNSDDDCSSSGSRSPRSGKAGNGDYFSSHNDVTSD